MPHLSALVFPLSRYQLEDESAHLDEMPLMMSEEGFENDESDYHTLPRARITRRKRGLEWFVCGGWKFLCTRFVPHLCLTSCSARLHFIYKLSFSTHLFPCQTKESTLNDSLESVNNLSQNQTVLIQKGQKAKFTFLVR